MMMRSLPAIALGLTVLLPNAVAADALARPTGPVVLTISGDIEKTNAEGAAEFDLEMLEALPGRETVIDTPWYSGTKTFSGPLISAVLDAVGAGEGALKVIALNDYTAEIPRDDVDEYPVILATRIDGERMSVREKGPSFVIYPFDVDRDLYSEVIFGRSVWQVAAIEVD
ncbi:hypothetical protein LX81_03939 [Palleronia aestuarii]|uniref:Oxidoreductase molybdopterin-binding domain-containing protein n=1 Tax=Palleronia aestuarii TaxID=568105 RepID=A0A2W7MTP0_9RHOB|nr:hypothetical protein [Palleronia aestuarii]PZX11348.1 hypothetical protein LX81_03939 [Palleronia aestuarii]